MFRTDKHNNPTAFTTQIAVGAGLVIHKDYEIGDPFEVPGLKGPVTYYTAKLLGDPIAITISVIDKITFYTRYNTIRWTYIAIPQFLWLGLTPEEKKKVIAFMYNNEGGTEMKHLFA